MLGETSTWRAHRHLAGVPLRGHEAAPGFADTCAAVGFAQQCLPGQRSFAARTRRRARRCRTGDTDTAPARAGRLGRFTSLLATPSCAFITEARSTHLQVRAPVSLGVGAAWVGPLPRVKSPAGDGPVETCLPTFAAHRESEGSRLGMAMIERLRESALGPMAWVGIQLCSLLLTPKRGPAHRPTGHPRRPAMLRTHADADPGAQRHIAGIDGEPWRSDADKALNALRSVPLAQRRPKSAEQQASQSAAGWPQAVGANALIVCPERAPGCALMVLPGPHAWRTPVCSRPAARSASPRLPRRPRPRGGS